MIRIVAALLVFLEPLRFAAGALAVVPTLSYRGPVAIAELVAHGLVAALSAAAGFALWNGSPDARRLARIAVIAVTARSLQSLTWSVLPNNTPPGSALVSAGVAMVVSAMALVVLSARSRPSGAAPCRSAPLPEPAGPVLDANDDSAQA